MAGARPTLSGGPLVAFVRRQPLAILAALAAVWILLALLNALLLERGVDTEVARSFPISVFGGPILRLSSLPYAAVFAALLALLLRRGAPASASAAWLAGLAFLLLGNLMQGSWDVGFLRPFYDSDMQYYRDAIAIRAWRPWLESFHALQPGLATHSSTHPPFAVLLHYALLRASGGSLSILSAAFVLAASAAVPLFWMLCRELQVTPARRGWLTLLFALLPAVNIYSAVSLDGVILAATTLFLVGLARLVQERRVSAPAVASCLAGFAIANLLTYGGVFLVGVAALLALWQVVRGDRPTVIAGVGPVLTVAVLGALVLQRLWGYDHLRGFMAASAIENPEGFLATSRPLAYVATRIEGVCEIAFFLSFGCLAAMVRRGALSGALAGWRRPAAALFLAGVATLAGMFLAGAYRTGETARACLFLYPYLLLAFAGEDERRIRDLVLLAGLQTWGMQLLGFFFW